MLKFTVKNLIRACQNDMQKIEIYRIRSGVHTAYDMEEDTDLVYSGSYMAEIDAETLESEVQDFFISPTTDDIIISI